MYKNTYKGRYKVINGEKYKGDILNVIYRSLWELKFMKWCDFNTAVVEWGSETVVIPYISPLDRKKHRYFVDFYVKIKNNNEVVKYLIEIKPGRFTKPPAVPKKKTKQFIDEVMAYGINEAKWKAANEYCMDRKMKFLVLTEKELGLESKINNKNAK